MPMFPVGIENLLSFLVLILAGISVLFLYFRSGRYEFVDDEVLFDTAFFAAIGALVGGRIADFLLRVDFYNWSLKKLFFFNAFTGFDWYGALAGAAIFVMLFLKNKKNINPLSIFDLACSPLIFASLTISLGNYILSRDFSSLFYTAGFLIIYWILKRLEKTKRYNGYLTSTTLILISILNLALFSINGQKTVLANLNYSIVMPASTLIAGIFFLYFLSKRHWLNDIKFVVNLINLSIFRLGKTLASVQQANMASKKIIFLPLSLSKSLLNLVKLVVHEVGLSLTELIEVLGIKK